MTIGNLGSDFRYSLRTLWKNPGFAAVAVIVLALGIGANTTIFSVINSLLLAPLPYHQPERLVRVWQRIPSEDYVSFSPAEFLEYSKQTQVFENLSAFTGNGFTLTGQGDPASLVGQVVTPSLFPLLGVNPALGRVFSAAEGEPGHEHVVMISFGMWKSNFGADPNIAGRAIILNNETYTVIGVMPSGFEFPGREYKLWVPAALTGSLFAKNPDAHFLRVMGRLRPGVTLARSAAELDALTQQFARERHDPDKRLFQVPFIESETSGVRRPLMVLAFAVGFVLLIACANVANLLLARATARHKEIAIRSALGASRTRIAVQMLTESTLLSLAGGGCGFLLAVWSVKTLAALSPNDLPRAEHIHIDYWVLAFTVAVSLATGLLFGLAPALTSARQDGNEALKQSGRGSAAGNVSRLRSALMFAEIAMSSVLLIGAGLMLRSFVMLESVNPGFRPDHVLTGVVVMPEANYPEAPKMIGFYRAALERLRALPGVDAVGVNTHLPFSGQDWGNGYEVEGRPAPRGQSYVGQVRVISPGYLAAMGIPLRAGRDFSERDSERAAPAVLINETLARKFWPSESPLGKRIQIDGPWRSVVGVVGNVKHLRLDDATGPEMYLPYPQFDAGLMKFLGRGITFVIHSSLDPSVLGATLRNEIRAVDQDVPVTDINSMRRMINDSVAGQRFRTWLIAIFSTVALVLACVGIYGVMSYNVTRRSPEVGIRIALGAQRRDVLWLVLQNAFWLAAGGAITGVAGAFLVTRGLASLLYEIKPHDALTFAAVPVLLVAMAMLASYIPARRATEVDPVTALRQE